MKRALHGLPVFPLAVLFGLNAADELDRTAFGLLLPEIRRAFGLNLAGITALSAAVIPAGLLFGLPVAYLADRRRRVPIAFAGATVWMVFTVLTGLAPSVVALAAARIGAGLGRAVNDPVHGSLLSDYYPPDVRAKVFSVHRAANTVGAFFGPLTAGVIAHALGWRAPFFVFAAPTVVLLVLTLLLREPARTGRGLTSGMPTFRRGAALLWQIGTLRRIWLSIPFLASASIGLGFLLSLYYQELFGVGVRQRGLIGAFDAPFIVAGLLVGAPLIDRGLATDPARVMRRIGAAAAAIALLVVGLAVAPTLWIAVALAYLMVGMASVLLAAGTAIVSLVAPPEARAAAFAFYGVFALIGIVVLPVVGVVGDAAGLRWGVAVLAPTVVAGAVILRTAHRFVAADMAAVAGAGAAPREGPGQEGTPSRG